MPRKKKAKVEVNFDEVFDNVMKRDKEIISLTTSNMQGMTISISKLPFGEFKQYLLRFFDPSGKICVLAIKKEEDRWTAYGGYPDKKDFLIDAKHQDNYLWVEWCTDNIRTAEAVSIMGELLDKNTATKIFSSWDADKYLEELD